ncbi:uncharacterized protein TrAFT101_007418 [Trichoderma asperellum]|uniref:uncharacterized protein n=1 Tax=Trichoderma asperellum TaxID=101201 RepID=UPI0033253094|nr:hypothetical protein TrAFT101_007418 [Trichoderma asperellum]
MSREASLLPGQMPRLASSHKKSLRSLSKASARSRKSIAGKLHTNRGHSEQVVRDMRMWLCDELRKIEEHQVSFLNVIAARAEQEIDCVML